MERIYRAEAFITLKTNGIQNSDPDINAIDDVKFANKLKSHTTKTEEEEEEEEENQQDEKFINKSLNIENISLNSLDTKTHESTESFNTSDSSKKASINSFNEYQEEPDFETLIKSPELLESYSTQLDINDTSSPIIGTFSGIKKCLVDFMEEEKMKVRKESYTSEIDAEDIVFNESFQQITEIKSLFLFNESEVNEKIVETSQVPQNVEANEEIEEKNKNQVQEENKEKEQNIIKEYRGEENEGKEEKEEIKIRDEVIQEKTENQENKLEFKKEILEINENFKTPKVFDFHKPISKLDQPIYDEPFIGNLHKNTKNTKKSNYDHSTLPNMKIHRFSTKQPRRCNSLKSIDEGVELIDPNFDDICYHGNKNGCTVAVQKPEDVSQEVFKDNWMQRLESLRQKEALLKDKEIALQSRERLLFKKEKELRILERMVKDKMKQAELYLKRCKNSQSLENVFDEKFIDTKSSSGSAASRVGQVLNVPNNSGKRVPFMGENFWLQAPELKYELSKENLKSLPPSRASYATLPSDVKYGSKFSAYSSFRCRPKPRISYDDLDSTLSADIGDSSLIVTSRKFDPIVCRKPAAFTRSASERRPKIESNKIISKEQYFMDDNGEFEEDKIFRKVSDNIFASQDKETKFLNYGVIDDGNSAKSIDRNYAKSEDDEKKSLNLDKAKNKNTKGLKTRPVSWSAETDDWLQRKREAFNLTHKKCVNNCDKENHELKPKTSNYSTVKKKSWKGKKFSIFR
ncbi:DNA ligase 1-like [Leptopilina boulardi]|uniref:DNA ligase 1-like n=1 Tax=Leptopilina boulardi TaxID=63433 RepID=UPI0021F636FB|nr:DNA ligase 1-like [Leptopilina boulardi]